MFKVIACKKNGIELEVMEVGSDSYAEMIRLGRSLDSVLDWRKFAFLYVMEDDTGRTIFECKEGQIENICFNEVG